MEQGLEQIRDQQRTTWNKFSPGWKKWDELTMDFLKPMGDEIIRLLRLRNDAIVLDVASGTGEPGLSIAATLSNGKVVLTDLAEDMLKIARENAVDRGIKNIETVTCDVCELPFADDSFDAISCRFGFMFFPDMQMAAKEMFRVLKPGGKIATSVWSIPGKNFWITASMDVITHNMDLPAPPPGAPGMFRCAKDQVMTDLFTRAGFLNVLQEEVTGKMNCVTVDVYWDMMNEIAAPVVNALSKADEPVKEKIKKEVFDAVNKRYPPGSVVIEGSALLIYGEK